MKFDKGTVNLMTRSLRQGWNNSFNVTESLVLSLWSGSELDAAALNSIKTNYTWDNTGRFQNHWPTALQTPRGSVERGRLTLHNFNDRYERVPFNYEFDFSERSELFSILSAGSVASFTLMLVGSTWTGYTNAASNEGRLLISGTVGLVGSGADLELSETNLTLNSRIVCSKLKIQMSFLNYDGSSWRISEAAPLIDTHWNKVAFLATFDNNMSEVISKQNGTLDSGVESYTNSEFGVASKAFAFNGSTALSYPNYALGGKAPGTGDFTYEIWCVPKMDSVSDTGSTLRSPVGHDTAPASNSSVYVYFNGVNRSIRVDIGATTVIAAVPNAFVKDVFCHVAVQRRSGVLYLYVNGWMLRSANNTTNVTLSRLRIGTAGAANTNFIGDVDAVRLTNAARYIRDFYLIDKQPAYFVDSPTDPENSATVSLVDFSEDTSKDLKTNESLIATAGASLPTVFDNGYAVFNGSQGVTTAKVGYGLGTTYTVEGYFIIDAPHSGSGILFGLGIYDNDASYFYINGTYVYFTDSYPFTPGPNIAGEVGDALIGRPNHVALVFDGTVMRTFLNGRKLYEGPRSRGVPAANQRIFLGSYINGLSYPLKGKIKGMRISNIARYTNNFLPVGSFVKYPEAWGGLPTANVIDAFWHRVAFLARFDDTINEAKYNVAGVQVSGTQNYVASSFGVSSKALSFDGNTVINYPDLPLIAKAPGTGDFTYEIWCVPRMSAATDGAGLSRACWGYEIPAGSNSSVYVFFNGTERAIRVAIGSTTVIPWTSHCFVPGVFCHVAVQRTGNKLALFINGWKINEVTNTTDINASNLKVGTSDSSANNFLGDIDAIRFTNAARYNGNFYLIDKQPDYFVTQPTDLNDEATVSLIDFSIDTTKDLKTGLPLKFATGTAANFDNGDAVFDRSFGFTTDQVGYGLGNVYTVECFFNVGLRSDQPSLVMALGTATQTGTYIYTDQLYVAPMDGRGNAVATLVPGESDATLRLRPFVENHVAMVFNGTKASVWINGRKVYEQNSTRSIPLAEQKLFIASWPTSDWAFWGGYSFLGRIRAVRISNIARYTDNSPPNGSFVNRKLLQEVEETTIEPKSDVLETTTEGWTLVANAPTGLVVSTAAWSEALSKMVTGIKVIDANGRVGFLSKETLRPTDPIEASKTHRTPDTYRLGAASDSYIYHHEIDGSSGQGLDYSYLYINRTDGLIWNNSGKWQFNALGQPQLPASIYIH